MELEQIIRYSDVFVGVMITFKVIVMIANEFLLSDREKRKLC